MITKKLIKEMEKAFKVACYDITFEAKDEYGRKHKWLLVTEKRIANGYAHSEQQGYDKRIKEEKEKSIFDLMTQSLQTL